MIRCNVCFAVPVKNLPRKFFVTECKHMYCQKCVTKWAGQCKICKSKCQIMEINKELPPSYKYLFMTRMFILMKNRREFTEIWNFRKVQRRQVAAFIRSQKEESKRLINQGRVEKRKLIIAERRLQGIRIGYWKRCMLRQPPQKSTQKAMPFRKPQEDLQQGPKPQENPKQTSMTKPQLAPMPKPQQMPKPKPHQMLMPKQIPRQTPMPNPQQIPRQTPMAKPQQIPRQAPMSKQHQKPMPKQVQQQILPQKCCN